MPVGSASRATAHMPAPQSANTASRAAARPTRQVAQAKAAQGKASGSDGGGRPRRRAAGLERRVGGHRPAPEPLRLGYEAPAGPGFGRAFASDGTGRTTRGHVGRRRAPGGEAWGCAAEGGIALRASLFATCLVDTLYPDAGRATLRVLERLGVAVDFPPTQTCCGQMHVNTGYRREALPMVRNFVRAFEASEAVVAPSASCVALVREAYPELAQESGDPALVAAVDALAPRVYELTEFLTDRLGVTDVGARFPHRVAYHPTCHSLRSLCLGDRPYRLLGAVRELELVAIEEADSCCGFGGTFALKNADVSSAMLADKIAAVLATGADTLCAADRSCLMHIGGGLARQGAPVRTLHLAEILAAGADEGSETT